MFVDIGGGQVLHAQVAGSEGTPVVLMLHSVGTSLHVWDAQADVLASRYRVVRCDMRGHGLSLTDERELSIDGFARDMLALLDRLGVREAHVAGLSIGGMIAQSMAVQAPARVRSLILCDTAMAIPPPSFWMERAATVRSQGMASMVDATLARGLTPSADAASVHGLRAMVLATPAEGYAAAAEAIARADLSVGTATIRVPALVLVGEFDEATPLSSAQALALSIPDATLEVIGGAAHIAPMERPGEVLQAMTSFLGEFA